MLNDNWDTAVDQSATVQLQTTHNLIPAKVCDVSSEHNHRFDTAQATHNRFSGMPPYGPKTF